jgi:hypothetical protein
MASALLTPGAAFGTKDTRCAAAAERLGIGYRA